MAKKLARATIEKVMRESQGQWLSAEEIMYRVNQTMPSRASVMVGTVAHHMRVLCSRRLVQVRNHHRAYEYRMLEPSDS